MKYGKYSKQLNDKVILRMPIPMKRHLQEVAQKHNCTVSQLIRNMIGMIAKVS